MFDKAPPFNSKLGIIHPKELSNKVSFRSDLNALINDVYAAHENDNPLFPNAPKFDSLRIAEDDQLFKELGPYGLIAVLFDEELCNAESVKDVGTQYGRGGSSKDYGGIVATASIKPWKGKLLDLYMKGLNAGKVQSSQLLDSSGHLEPKCSDQSGPKSRAEIYDWEVSLCACINESKYRRTGLIGRCVDALRQTLIEERKDLKREDHGQLRFWVTASPGIGNVEYWSRRGFVVDGPLDRAPAGLWGSKEEFELATMSKVVA